MDSRSNSPTDYEIISILRSSNYNLRDLEPVNYAESPLLKTRRKQRSRSSDAVARKEIQTKRCVSVPPANIRKRRISEFLFGESASEKEEEPEKKDEEFEISVYMRRRTHEGGHQSRSRSPKNNPTGKRRGRKKSTTNNNVSNSDEEKLNYTDGESTPSYRETSPYGRVKKRTASPGKTENLHLNICIPISTSKTPDGHHESCSSKQRKGRRKSTHDHHPKEDVPKGIKNHTTETKTGKNEYLSSHEHAKKKGKDRRKSMGAESHQESSHQRPPHVRNITSETSKGRNGNHSPRKHLEKDTTRRRKSTGDKSFQESSCNPVNDLKVREMKYTLCEKLLEAMYRDDGRKKLSPKNTGNINQLKISIPFKKIFSGNEEDNADLLEVLSNGNDADMVHFKKKLIQRSVPTDQNSTQESTQSQQPAEESAQSSSSLGVLQEPIRRASELVKPGRIRSASQSESRRISLPLSALEMSPASTSTNATSVPQGSRISARESEKRQGVKRQIAGSAPNPSALDYSSERNAVSSLSSGPKQPTTSNLLQPSLDTSVSDPSSVHRPRSNSVKHQKQFDTDKTPASDPRHQDDFSAARTMNCTITRLETPNSIPVNIQIGKTNDLETTKTLLILVDSIMRNNELSVENLMALNKFYRDLKNYQISNNPDEGLRREIEDRTKHVVGFVAKHLIGTQCNRSYIERMLLIDLQPHEQFFRRYIREIKHYARDQQSMETLIRNLSNSEKIVLLPRSTEVPAKVVRFDHQQDLRTQGIRQVDPRTAQPRPPTMCYGQLQKARPRLPFAEVPRNNFRMINAPQMQYFSHNQQGQNNVYLNHPMFSVPPPSNSAPMNNNQNWRRPVQMIGPPNYTLSRMLAPPNSRSIVTFTPNRYNIPRSQSLSNEPTALQCTAPPNITEFRDSNGTTSTCFSSPNSGIRERFKAASYDINMNNSAYPNSFNTLDPMNKAAFMRVMNDSRNMVRPTPPPAPANVNNPDATPSGYFIHSSPRDILRDMPSVDNTEANNQNSTVSTPFAHENHNNASTPMPSPNTETNQSGVPYVQSNLRSNSIELDNKINVSGSKKSTLDSNAAVMVHQNGRNSFNRSSSTQNETLVKNSCTSDNEIAGRSTEKEETPPITNHPITVVDQSMTVILTKNPVKGQVENRGDCMSVPKVERVKNENEDLKGDVRVWYYAQQLKRWKKIVKDTNPKIYQQILNRCENDSSVIIVDDNDKEDDNDVCFVAQYSKESSNNITARTKENNSRKIKEDIPDEETTVMARETSSSLHVRRNMTITNETDKDNFHSREITEQNTQLSPSENFYIHNSNIGAPESRNSNSYYIQQTSREETIRNVPSNFQLRSAQIVRNNSEMLRLSNANEPIRAELQPSSDIHGDIVSGYAPQFQTTQSNMGNARELLHFQLERTSDSTSGLQGTNWRVWMSNEGERRLSHIHETPTVASRHYSSHDEWFQVGHTKAGTTVSNKERIIKMVQSKLVYDEVNHSLVSFIEDTNGNERRIETFLPSNVFLSGKDFLSNPELYIKEYGIVANHAPLGYLQYYRYVTGFQIVRNKPPVSFLMFLQLNNAGHLRQLLAKFLNSLENNGDGNSYSPV